METPTRRTVAIVGRPNVGKSALFNRLAGRRISIVHDQPGVTRDRLHAECRLGERPFTIIDTGGIGTAVDATFTEQVHLEVDIAIQTADVILFLVDGQSGVTPVDLELAQKLRRVDKPLILGVNKIDHANHESLDLEFQRLGFDCLIPLSAEHARGVGDLIEAIEAQLPTGEETGNSPPDRPLELAIVGRPNVGKSSLINAIMSDRRTLVSAVSGTTRDAVDIPYQRGDRSYILIDTAGIRAKGKQSDSVEVFSVMRSERTIRRADLCVLVIDAVEGVTSQDKKIAGLIQEARRPCLIVANKWDLTKPEKSARTAHNAMIERTREQLFFLDYAPIIPTSAMTGENLRRVFRFIELVQEHSGRRITTGVLNRRLSEALAAHNPPARANRRLKLLYALQLKPDPRELVPAPQFVLFVNDPALMEESYLRYLEGDLRKEAAFTGLPLVMKLKGREPRKRS